MRWHGDHGAFLRQCWEMAREYGTRLPRCSDDIPVYAPELERCDMAVDVALPSQAVTGPAKLLVPWINHHGLFAVRELRELDATQRALQTSDGRRLLSCFLDFVLQPSMLRTALEGPQHPDTLPGVVNLDSPEPPALAARPQAGAPSTTARAEVPSASRAPSPAQRALDLNSSPSAPAPMAPQQPITAMPQAPWVLPPELGAPPTSPVRPNSSSSSSSPATTSPLPRTPSGGGAVAESEGGPAARTRARTSPAKSPANSPVAKSPANSPDGH